MSSSRGSSWSMDQTHSKLLYHKEAYIYMHRNTHIYVCVCVYNPTWFITVCQSPVFSKIYEQKTVSEKGEIWITVSLSTKNHPLIFWPPNRSGWKQIAAPEAVRTATIIMLVLDDKSYNFCIHTSICECGHFRDDLMSF